MKKRFENIYTFDFFVKLLPGASFPVRSTFLELENNELLIIAPGPFDEEPLKRFVAQYSKTYCLAPNAFHHFFLERFHEVLPHIDIYAPFILEKKQPKLRGKFKEIELLSKALLGQVDFYPILGNEFLSETVLYFRPSKTLIVTDLIFNMQEPMPWGRKLLLHLVGAYNKPAQSRLIKKTTKDKDSYFKSIGDLQKFECERLIMAHGEIIHGYEEVGKVLEKLKA